MRVRGVRGVRVLLKSHIYIDIWRDYAFFVKKNPSTKFFSWC